jgi:hypothetical protein
MKKRLLNTNSIFLTYFCNRMTENRRNSSPAILFFILMIVFFSFIQKENKKPVYESSISSILKSSVNNSNPQAILAPALSAPQLFSTCIHSPYGKYIWPDFNSIMEIKTRQQNPTGLFSSGLTVISTNNVTGLTLHQKVPGKEKSDDSPPVI